MDLKISKYKLVKGIGSVTFRSKSGNIVKITDDNITDELVQLAIEHDKEHCFVLITGEKKNINPSKSQFPQSLSTLTEVKTDENDSLPAQPNKRVIVSEEKPKGKRGRKPKSKD